MQEGLCRDHQAVVGHCSDADASPPGWVLAWCPGWMISGRPYSGPVGSGQWPHFPGEPPEDEGIKCYFPRSTSSLGFQLSPCLPSSGSEGTPPPVPLWGRTGAGARPPAHLEVKARGGDGMGRAYIPDREGLACLHVLRRESTFLAKIVSEKRGCQWL